MADYSNSKSKSSKAGKHSHPSVSVRTVCDGSGRVERIVSFSPTEGTPIQSSDPEPFLPRPALVGPPRRTGGPGPEVAWTLAQPGLILTTSQSEALMELAAALQSPSSIRGYQPWQGEPGSQVNSATRNGPDFSTIIHYNYKTAPPSSTGILAPRTDEEELAIRVAANVLAVVIILVIFCTIF